MSSIQAFNSPFCRLYKEVKMLEKKGGEEESLEHPQIARIKQKNSKIKEENQ